MSIGKYQFGAKKSFCFDRREVTGWGQKKPVGFEKFFHIYLARRIGSPFSKELSIVFVERAVKDDLVTEKAVVKSHLRGEHGSQIHGVMVIRDKNLFLEPVDQIDGIRLAMKGY